MDETQRKTLLALAREAIRTFFSDDPPLLYERMKREQRRPYTDELGCFVTLHTKKDGALRGCIGNLWPKGPLYDEIFQLARQAAFNDPRFHPLKKEEVSSIDLEISLLSSMQAVDDYHSIKLGVDGVLFAHGYHRSVFLPQVATEQGWDLDTMLSHLAMKAGMPPTAYRDGMCHFEIFQAEVFKEA